MSVKILRNTQSILNTSSTVVLDKTQLENYKQARTAITELSKVQNIEAMEMSDIIEMKSLPTDDELMKLIEGAHERINA